MVQIGDLVKINNEWVRHNPWMRNTIFDGDGSTFGLVIANDNFGLAYFYVLIQGSGQTERVASHRLTKIK